MTTQHFKSSARSLAAALDNAGIIYDVYQLLNLTDSLVTGAVDFTEPETLPTDHDNLVLRVLGDPEVMKHLREDSRIKAIKVLRDKFPGPGRLGLREARDAVCDHRVSDAAGIPRYL